MKIELKPCPFCGGVVTAHVSRGPVGQYYPAFIYCYPCELTMKAMSSETGSESRLAATWNTRAALDAKP